MVRLLRTIWCRLREWWVDLPMTLWVRSLTAQELREQYRIARILDVDAPGAWVHADARRIFRFVERELTRRGLDP